MPLLIAGVVSSVIFLVHLGRNTLADWDEAWYADASRQMFREDHFLTPIWNGQYFFDKPPFQYWMTQPFLYAFGETEMAYRLPSALASIGLTVLVFLWGFRIKTKQTTKERVLLGLSAASVLLSFPHFVDRGRSGNFDGLFIFLATLSLYLFLLGKRKFAGVSLGLSWLTKGIFPGLFPVVTLLPFACYDYFKNKNKSTFFHLAIFVGMAAIVYAPWHLFEVNRFEDLIEKSYFASFDQGEFGDHNWTSIVWRFDLRYLAFLWTFLRWWFPVFLVSVGWMMLKLDGAVRRKKPLSTEQLLRSYLPVVAFMVVFTTLSVAKTKNDWYIMPTYPFIALMTADLLLLVGRRLWGGREVLAAISVFAFANLWFHRGQAFPPNKHLAERQVAEYVRAVTLPDEKVVTAEYEFPTLRYYSEREVRTAARQPDFQGKYWWIWDNTDIATALRHGTKVVTVHRPGTEWSIGVPGWERRAIGEINGRVISRLVPLSGEATLEGITVDTQGEYGVE